MSEKTPDNNMDSVGNVDQMVECEYEDQLLPVPLTDRERLELGQDMAAEMSKAEQAERDKKAADEQFKGSIESAYAEVSNIAGVLRHGKTDKMVQCKHIMDYRLGHVRVIRMDDDSEIVNRQMTREERQMGMHFDDTKEK